MKYPFIFIAFCLVMSLTISCKKSSSPGDNAANDTLATGWVKLGTPFLHFNSGGDIVFQDNSTGYVSSKSDNATFKTTNGGANWIRVSNTGFQNMGLSPDHKLFGVNTLYDSIFRSGDGGASFSSQLLNVATAPYDVSFGDNNTGVICSNKGLYYTLNGGSTWNPLGTLTAIPGEPGVNMFSNNTGWVVFNDKVYHANGNINSWHLDSVPSPTSNIGLIGIAPVSASVVYVVSMTGYLFKSTDGGYTFTYLQKIPTGTVSSKCDIQFLDANTGYLSNGSRIYKTTDGGNNWTMIVGLNNQSINEIHFVDASHGWALGNFGDVFKLN